MCWGLIVLEGLVVAGLLYMLYIAHQDSDYWQDRCEHYENQLRRLSDSELIELNERATRQTKPGVVVDFTNGH